MNNKRIILGLLLLSACSQQKQPVQQIGNNDKLASKPKLEIQLDTATFVVLPFAAKFDYLFPKSMPAVLTNAEIQHVNELLIKAVAEHNQAQEKDFAEMIKSFPDASHGRENYFINLSNYKRQLIAVITSEGKKEVWVNCFCSSHPYWRIEAVSVDDGGNCYFNVKINLTDEVWSDMMVNGIA